MQRIKRELHKNVQDVPVVASSRCDQHARNMLDSVKMTLVLIAFFLIQTRFCLADVEREQKELAIVQECATQHHIDTLVKSDVMSHDYKCFVSCTFTKMEYVDEKGDTNVATYKMDHEVDDDDLKTMDECAKDNADEDLCEKVFKTQTCIKVYFDIK